MIYKVTTEASTGLDDIELIPVANGIHYTQSMIIPAVDGYLEYQTGDFALCFYDSDGVTPITPTAGSVVPTMSPISGVWLAPGVGDTSIVATSVIVDGDGIATYSVPVFLGGAVQGRIELSGIEGATYVKAQFRRFK